MNPETPELPPVSSLDDRLKRTLRRSERLTWVIVSVLVVLLGGMGLLFWQQSETTHQIDERVHRDVASICGFMKIIGTVQVPPAASLILVQWVESARVAYYGHGCVPALAPPSPGLRTAAAKYRVPLSR